MAAEPRRGRLAPLWDSLRAEDPHRLAHGGQLAYRLSFGLTALLGAVLGLLALWLRPLDIAGSAAGILVATATALAAVMFWVTRRRFAGDLLQAGTPGERRLALLSAAFSLAVAPVIPWLLACVALAQWPLALALAGLSAAVYGLGLRQLREWAKQV